jgi:hypothetical protein
MNENIEKYSEIVFRISNYCLNMCYEKKNLREYRNCFVTCISYMDKKLELIEKNLEIVDNIMQDKIDYTAIKDNKTNFQDQIYKNSSSRLKSKYIFEDYYYLANPEHDVGKPKK